MKICIQISSLSTPALTNAPDKPSYANPMHCMRLFIVLYECKLYDNIIVPYYMCLYDFFYSFFLTCFIYQHHNIIISYHFFPGFRCWKNLQSIFYAVRRPRGYYFSSLAERPVPSSGLSYIFRKSKFRNLIQFVTKSCFCYSSTDSETK